jgi:hypothetical protein
MRSLRAFSSANSTALMSSDSLNGFRRNPRQRLLGSFDGLFVAVSGEVHDRRTEPAVQHFGRVHPVEVSLNPDIHEDQIRAGNRGLLHGVLRRSGNSGHFEAMLFEALCDIRGDDSLIFHNEDAARPAVLLYHTQPCNLK